MNTPQDLKEPNGAAPLDATVRPGIFDIGTFDRGDYKEEAACAYRMQGRIAERLADILPFVLETADPNTMIYKSADELNAWLDYVRP